MYFDALCAQELFEVLGGKVDLAQNFAHQGAGEVPPRMVWNRRRPAVRMAVEHVAPFLADSVKT